MAEGEFLGGRRSPFSVREEGKAAGKLEKQNKTAAGFLIIDKSGEIREAGTDLRRELCGDRKSARRKGSENERKSRDEYIQSV
mgnify:CR=1 FL=1